MTAHRNKKQDIKITDQYIQKKENVVRSEKSWLDHTKGGAELDYELLQGATISEMMKSSGRLENSVFNHISHLDIEHGLVVSEKDGVYKLEPSRLKGTLNKKNEGLFKAVQSEHIYKAVEDFKIKGAPKGLGSSKFYDVRIGNELYPPKPIMAYANFYADGRQPGNYFSGGVNTPCFNAYERIGIEIIEKTKSNIMELTETYLKEFAQIADRWFTEQTWLLERYDYFQKFFTIDNLEKSEWSDFQEMGNNIHAFVSLALAKQRALGRLNLPIEDYRRIFLYLISGEDDINSTINNLLPKSGSDFELPFFGNSSISELVAYAYPEKYVTYNTRDIDALEILGLKLGKVKGEKFGELFLRYNRLLEPILESYKNIVGQRTKTTIPLELDQFFSWLYKTKRSDKPLKILIEDYKERIKVNHLEYELYKWKFIEDYRGKPNLEADNFQAEIKALKLGNLVYNLTGAVLNDLAKDYSEELRDEFKKLYNESESLELRIKNWNKQITKVYAIINSKHGHHQDERALSVYLTLHDPEQYTFYKSSYYKKFCDLLGVKPKGKGQKYVHYLELINMFVNDYISKDHELIDLIESLIPEDNDASNHLLLAQDILYQMLDQNSDGGYWIFQGNPKIYDFQGAVNDEALSSWSVKAHKNKIAEGDKIIFWLTGDKPGCYALGEVTSEVYNSKDEDKDFEYYLDKKENEVSERVDIDITHNLVDVPILKSELTEIRALKKLKAGNQGTNFLASKEEYEAILDLIHKSDISFEEVLHRFDSNDLIIYFSFLREIIDHFNLQLSDKRLVFAYQNDRLNFTVGQRYCWNLFRPNRQGKFGVISKEKLLPESKSFTGKSREHYYNYYNEINFNNDDKNSIFTAINDQLRKTNKSSYYKYNSTDFEDYAFDYLPSTTPNTKTMTEPINRILFGPPGTGKTFRLKDKYFEKYTTKETSISKEKNFENVVKNLSWWQVISLAVLELKRARVGVIYDNRWIQQKAKLSDSKTVRQTLWSELQKHTIQACEFVNVKGRQAPLIFNKSVDSYWEILEDEVKEQVPELYDIKYSVDNFIPNPDKEIKRYVFTTFHQSFAYEDFIEGIKPIISDEQDESGELAYEIQNGVFKELCMEAQNDPENKYAIFIDEINRGNVSNIFGELITLIEQDKRKGATNAMSALLPYSKKKFSVPNNVDIYGTMNTADRSVEALDTALRRRFSFQEVMPNPDILVEEIEGISLREVLITINDRIEVLIDRDHTIGHSYFMGIKDAKELKMVFKDKIIPLLQEYFYGDYGKIGLVLGDGFVERQKKKENLFADFMYERKDELNNDFYILKPIDDSFSIVDALKQLMNSENEED